MLWVKKMAIAGRIAELPSPQRDDTRRVWDILNNIELSWMIYPIYAVATVVLGVVTWMAFFGGEIPDFAPAPSATGPMLVLTIYIIVYPLTKLLLLARTKRLLADLKSELDTVEGNRAGNILDDWDRQTLWAAKRAAQRSLLAWLW